MGYPPQQKSGFFEQTLPECSKGKFNTHEQDRTGLQYFNARYYDPELGRFAQADPTVPDPSNSQCFNRYMFVLGNPISFVDMNGFQSTNEGLGGMPSDLADKSANHGETGGSTPDYSGLENNIAEAEARSKQKARAEAEAEGKKQAVIDAYNDKGHNSELELADPNNSLIGARKDAISNGLFPYNFNSPSSKSVADKGGSPDSSTSNTTTPAQKSEPQETGPGRMAPWIRDGLGITGTISGAIGSYSWNPCMGPGTMSRAFRGVVASYPRIAPAFAVAGFWGAIGLSLGIAVYDVVHHPEGMSVLEALGRVAIADGIPLGVGIGVGAALVIANAPWLAVAAVGVGIAIGGTLLLGGFKDPWTKE